MKIFPLLVLLLNPLVAAEKLDKFQWEKRLLVITERDPAIEKAIRMNALALLERDVVIFVLDDGSSQLDPGPELEIELRKRLKVRENVPEVQVLLLGKDGKTTIRWKAADFTMGKMIREIDSMPMRQKEMRR